ncbi:alpha-2-macroglobulin-like [Panulirus ornatus]|uniref:alpha-2-macroglobulin-like n=1 Tax=Panulirus ornatus TaxID=150431 RepID=UPI003A863C7D
MASFKSFVVTSVLAAILSVSQGCFMITTPRQWTAGESVHVCVVVSDPSSPPGHIVLTLSNVEDRLRYQVQKSVVVIPTTKIKIPAGKAEVCRTLKIPFVEKNQLRLCLSGQLCGTSLFRQIELSIVNTTGQTFIQTDKFLYKPGQKVQFRVLTIEGTALKVSTLKYPEVWVTTPSGTRIAQWRDVDNSAGLIHMDLNLADEPEEGSYTVFVRTQYDKVQKKSFRVEEYVLPRFEMTFKPPPSVLAIDSSFNFTVCAKYTFGQPVKGSVILHLKNNEFEECEREVEKHVKIHGCIEMNVMAREMGLWACRIHNLLVNATVIEEGTDVAMSKSANVRIRRLAFTFKSIHEDKYMKPNLPFTFKVRVERLDKTPAAGEPIEVCCSSRCSSLTTGADGYLIVSIPYCDDHFIKLKGLTCWTYMYSPHYYVPIQNYFSPTNSSVLIRGPDKTLRCSSGLARTHVLHLIFASVNMSTIEFTVQVASHGQIYYSKTKRCDPADINELIDPHLLGSLPPLPEHYTRGQVEIPIVLPPTSAPTVKVLVWFTGVNGEVVSDSRELEVEKCLSNKVNFVIKADDKAEPGASAELELTSLPQSLCSVGVVDKSVELLASQQSSLTIEQIFKHLEHYKIPNWLDHETDDDQYCRIKLGSTDRAGISYTSKYVDALRMFDESGVYVFSDSTLETRPCETKATHPFEPYPPRPMKRPQHGFQMNQRVTSNVIRPNAKSSNVVSEEEESDSSPEDQRTEFPETWLWDLHVIPDSGVKKEQVTLPDTITEWVGEAVCVHPRKGVGLSKRMTITTFTPFFADLTLPPSVKRGEILHVKITVFNYLDDALPVTVFLPKTKQLQVIRSSNDSDIGRRSSCLGAKEKVVHTVKVKPLELGDVNITVSAVVDNRIMNCTSKEKYRDAMVKPIKVEPEGFPKEKTWTKYVCPEDPTASKATEKLNVSLPNDVVEGSARGWVTVVGDLLALTLENLGHLIRMPSGCGEQNMVNFAPNIFIMQYLTISRQITRDTARRLKQYMEEGYQRELRYQHPDGSFSAFGPIDGSGSTWLTAFVLKSFSQAQPYIMIDKEQLKKSQAWLLSKQSGYGCFLSVGKVIHKAMKGGIGGKTRPITLTAYVIISLLEAGMDPTDSAVQRAIQCLRSYEVHDLYPLALKAYALSLARLHAAETAIQQIMTSIQEGDVPLKYIEDGKGTALGVETAGYLVLAMMTLNPMAYKRTALNIVKWITEERNGQGGFHSTQDTVVALQALAKFASYVYKDSLDVEITVRAKDLHYKFVVQESNKLLQQRVVLPELPALLSHSATGKGCAVVQAVLRYNTINPEPSDAFDLHVRTQTAPDRNCNTKSITACTSYLLPDGESNMAIIEVDVVSGYLPMKDDLGTIIMGNKIAIKKFDVDGSKVSLYLDNLTAEKVCVDFRVVREADVERVKPGTVSVYDYYEPSFKISETYILPPASECIRKW